MTVKTQIESHIARQPELKCGVNEICGLNRMMYDVAGKSPERVM